MVRNMIFRKIMASALVVGAAVGLLFINGCGHTENVSMTMEENSEKSDDVKETSINDNAGSDEVSSIDQVQEDTLVEDVILDEDNIPDEISAMLPLCDALNIVQCESGELYNPDDDAFVWRTIHIQLVNSDWKKEGFTIYDDCISVNNSKVKECAFGLFGDLNELPIIPNEMLNNYECFFAGTAQEGDINYNFSLGDRGLSKSRIKSAVVHGDTTVTLEVELFDVIDESEIVDFFYTLRINTKDLSTAARYQYEIVGATEATENTKNWMNGIPSVTFVEQFYGVESDYEEGDVRSNEIVEIPFYNSVRERDSVDELNARISNELMSLENQIDSLNEWREIKSYPVSTENYIQVITTYNIYPTYGTHGDVVSYNYDVKNDKAMELSDALALCGVEGDELADAAMDVFSEFDEYSKLRECWCQGFLIREDGTVDFYFKIFYDSTTGSEPFDVIGSYNYQSKASVIYDIDDDLVSEKMVDEMFPPLTHGKE